MKATITALAAALLATPLLASDDDDHARRQLDSHVHGVSELEVEIEGSEVEIELRAPGADIVGFEHPARTASDRNAVDAAIRALSTPDSVFTLPGGAACVIEGATARLASFDDYDDDYDDRYDDDRDSHDDRDDDHDEGHDHADGHSDDHDDHDDEHHDDHAHDDDQGYENGAGHSAFHAEYRFSCANPAQLKAIEFTYFDSFEHAQVIAARYVTDAGAGSAAISAGGKLVLE